MAPKFHIFRMEVFLSKDSLKMEFITQNGFLTFKTVIFRIILIMTLENYCEEKLKINFL